MPNYVQTRHGKKTISPPPHSQSLSHPLSLRRTHARCIITYSGLEPKSQRKFGKIIIGLIRGSHGRETRRRRVYDSVYYYYHECAAPENKEYCILIIYYRNFYADDVPSKTFRPTYVYITVKQTRRKFVIHECEVT